MSSWIHANGVIMLSTPCNWYTSDDGEETKNKDLKYIREQVFGKVINFDDETFGEIHMPYGSEGSLDYTITECAGYINIVICGNLRDRYEKDLDEIETWYKTIIQKLNDMQGIYVREHIFEAYVENGEKRIMSSTHSEILVGDEFKEVSVIKIPCKFIK